MVIGDSLYVPVVIGERRNSGGGNINVLRIREKALGCYIPFSMANGTTPFRVFIFKSGCKREGTILAHAVTETAERRLRKCPHRVFLESEKGFLTAKLFKIVMEELVKWRKLANSGLHCFLLSDNLKNHVSKAIMKTACKHGIHVLNIIPGTSHWFQVHDQLPFANLKKKLANEKMKCSRFFSHTPGTRKALFVEFIY